MLKYNIKKFLLFVKCHEVLFVQEGGLETVVSAPTELYLFSNDENVTLIFNNIPILSCTITV
jgi:hypothetical protein